MDTIVYYSSFVILTIIFVMLVVLLSCRRWLIKHFSKQIGKILLTDSYPENIAELIPGLRHMGFQNALENNFRAQSGMLLHRPLGSSKKWPHLDSITFIPAQTSPFPIDSKEEVDVTVTIGPKAKKPLKINIPMMISGMGYGIAVSEQVRYAMVEGAKKAGTAINSGEGGILAAELLKAGKYILQFSRTAWAKDVELIKRANMIEIKLGQGAVAGMGWKIPSSSLTAQVSKVLGLQIHEDAVIHETFFENQTIAELKELVDELRHLSGGVPIGVKIGAGGKIEEDIDHVMELGVDFIAIDGGQGGSYGAPPLLSDDMGIPTLHGIVRAAHHLKKRKMKEEISLISSAGLYTPGHFLKMLALGADAVYLGSSILFAVSHKQNLQTFPFEPPTQIVWEDGKMKDQFVVAEGAKAVEKFLTSSTEEIKTALRAMGKRSLKELSNKDLVSHDRLTARMIGIPFSFEPLECTPISIRGDKNI
ncbi:FMN-binding glutamate synthase family protein [Bacillus sp. DNRA2]|uniref:FMN-binding glutamate synthase family protein n=1 Tax=Bacillus sp. DNRA2 TaxID=2723053 RepID=UPI00145D5F7D|nr:FMN-binding glutamate synthase family protein [Bacillus sp. DNRA2]NMD69297.1 FMN-binding glutamate synthase family protein [Bacillus sp. DNRA2]